MKNIFGILAAVVLVLAVATPVNAVTRTNRLTGPGSTNVKVVVNAKVAVVNTENCLTLTNIVNTTANTGGNSVMFNTKGGTITTGAATASATIVNNLNRTVVTVNQ
jgi:hypothetical protein